MVLWQEEQRERVKAADDIAASTVKVEVVFKKSEQRRCRTEELQRRREVKEEMREGEHACVAIPYTRLLGLTDPFPAAPFPP